MFRRCFSFVFTAILFSALNADVIVSNDSFSYQFSKQLEVNIQSLLPLTSGLAEKFTKSSIEIIAEQDGSNLDSLIINTIISLVNEINPETAANLYLALNKNIFDKAFAPSNLEILTSSKSKEELQDNLKIFFQKLFELMSSKEVNLKAAVCFATFTDETVKEITNAMSNCMQSYIIKLNELTNPETTSETDTETDYDDQTESSDQTESENQTEINTQIDTDMQNQINSINALLSELSKNILTSIASVFENHGYKIDHQALGL